MAIAYTATSSPCNNVCQMDEDWGVCVGCFRTLDEIVQWSQYSDDEKRAVLSQVKRRSGGDLSDLNDGAAACRCAGAADSAA